MKALIVSGRVQDIHPTGFDVADPWYWVDCDETVTYDDLYENGIFTKPVHTEPTYDYKRRYEYPQLADFADAYYWMQKGNDTKMNEYLAKITEIKEKFPKG